LSYEHEEEYHILWLFLSKIPLAPLYKWGDDSKVVPPDFPSLKGEKFQDWTLVPPPVGEGSIGAESRDAYRKAPLNEHGNGKLI
jgi:hypothetical protein